MKKDEEQPTLDSSNSSLEWTPEKPIKILPENIKKYFIEEADYLYNDLKEKKLHKIHMPAYAPAFPEQMGIVTQVENPEWYSELYRSYHFHNKSPSRCFDSLIRRDRSLRALDKIKNEKDKQFIENIFKPSQNWIDKVYRELIYDRLTEGHDDLGYFVKQKNEVRKFFDLEPIIENIPF